MRFSVKIHASFVAYLICTALLSSAYCCVAVVLSLVIHELGHCIVGMLLKEKIIGLEFTPFGGILTYMPGTTPSKGIRGMISAVSGPAANGLLIAFMLGGWSSLLPSEFIRQAIWANLAMIALNLIPVLPLDGGQILFCIGYYIFPVAGLISLLSYAGAFVGVFLTLLSMWGLINYNTFNCSLFIIGMYLFASAGKCRRTLFAENILAIIQERHCEMEKTRRIYAYRVSANAPLYSLLRYITPFRETAFMIHGIDSSGIVTESVFLNHLQKNPTHLIGEVLKNTNPDDFQNKSCFSP